MSPIQAGDPQARFWSKVVQDDSGCWLWQATVSHGYGHFAMRFKGPLRNVRAHRFAYESLVGPIPPGLELDHICHVPRCVNPAHLEPVTHAENMRRISLFKTHCPQGHPYSTENSYFAPNGWRRCRTCKRDGHRAWRAKKAAA